MTWAYYIYYRVDPDKVVACTTAVKEVLARMHTQTGVQGRYLKKRNEPLLWMEIYEHVTDEAQFEWGLAEAVAASGIAASLQAGNSRHVECFAE